MFDAFSGLKRRFQIFKKKAPLLKIGADYISGKVA